MYNVYIQVCVLTASHMQFNIHIHVGIVIIYNVYREYRPFASSAMVSLSLWLTNIPVNIKDVCAS